MNPISLSRRARQRISQDRSKRDREKIAHVFRAQPRQLALHARGQFEPQFVNAVPGSGKRLQ
jgi:hypothetical protein